MTALMRRWTLDSQLLVAIKNNDVPRAHQLFQAGVDTDTRFSINSQTRPALCLCVENNASDMVRLLVELGVSINQGDSVGLTPLHIACIHGYPDLAGLLLKARANVNARTHQRRTPLHLAAMRGNQAITEILISRGANVNVIDEGGRTPLHHAVSSANSEVVELLLAAQACPTLVDIHGNTALHTAVDVNGVRGSTLRKLCRAFPEAVGIANTCMELPLHIAVRSGRHDAEDVLRTILEVATKVSINTQGSLGHTPLHMAVLEHHIKLLQLLLTAGADTNTEDDLGHSPLVSAARDERLGAVALLVAAGARTKQLIQGGVVVSDIHNMGIRMLLEEATRQPPRLSGLCRRAITVHLGPATLPTLEKATLPTVWREFLTFQSLNI